MRAVCAALLCLGLSNVAAQAVIELPYENAGGMGWQEAEIAYFSEIWNTQVVTNVSAPTMQAFRPKKELATGTSVVIAPGGGFYALSIESEGNQVARWLADKGITAFVLKYRLVPTGKDGVREVSNIGDRFYETVKPIIPLATSDGLRAIEYVRENAARYDLDPGRIGFMGFSAGGTVTVSVATNATPESRPDFIVPVYPAVSRLGTFEAPDNPPPMLVICASDDGLDLAPDSIRLYSTWLENGASAALHMYAKGGHGFGMRTQNLPSDDWIERFYQWSIAEGIVEAPEEKRGQRTFPKSL